MAPFVSRFRQLGFREMRTLIFMNDPVLPDGPFGFLEFYCNEKGCDCRRVLFHVVRPDGTDRVWASINYGWEEPTFYRQWYRGAESVDEMATASLDPFNPQSEYSGALLERFRTILIPDQQYVDRLKRHYRMFKGLPGPMTPGRTGMSKRRKRRGGP